VVLYDIYREAWHLLHEPDGLEFRVAEKERIIRGRCHPEDIVIPSNARDLGVAFARVGRTLLSDAFDAGFDVDLDREGHGLSRATKPRQNGTRLQPLRYALAVVPRNGERPVCPRFIPRASCASSHLSTPHHSARRERDERAHPPKILSRP
jgi:hypothetical protein